MRCLRLRRERALRAEQILDLLDARAHGPRELRGERGRLEVAADPNEQLVVEDMSQPREDAAHRGLAQMQALARARHVALDQQSVERDKEVQIELAQVHRLIRNASARIGNRSSSQPRLTINADDRLAQARAAISPGNAAYRAGADQFFRGSCFQRE